MELSYMYRILILSGISKEYIDRKIEVSGYSYKTLSGILYEFTGYENFDEYLEGGSL